MLYFLYNLSVIKFSIFPLYNSALFLHDNFIKFSFNSLNALSSFSINVTFFAPLDKHSSPNEPTPE